MRNEPDGAGDLDDRDTPTGVGSRMLRIWGRVVSPLIPVTFALALGTYSFVVAAVARGPALWLVIGAVGVATALGGVTAILLQRRSALRKGRRWP